jgi:xanthine dehydrogenase YagR molybdenum-binding subunit
MIKTTPHRADRTENRPGNKGSSLNDDASRMDGVQKVTGRARYARDTYVKGGLFVGFVRCPYGAATLTSCDEAGAKGTAGVVEVELKAKRVGQYHGQNIGYVVAESPSALRRGLRALQCKWERAESIVTTIDSVEMAKVDLTPDTNALVNEVGQEGTFSAVYSTQVQTHTSLETHGVSIDYAEDRATVYASTQGTFAVRDGLDEALKLDASQYEVVCEYVGGGFGSKLNGAGLEGMTAARVAAKYKRPVYLFCNRAEEHLDTGNRPSSRVKVTMAFSVVKDAAGSVKGAEIKGGDIQTWGGVGPNKSGGGVAIPGKRYKLGLTKNDHTDVALNAGMPRPFRAPGHPQGAFAEELMIEEIAHRAGVDSLTFRMELFANSNFREMAEAGAKLIQWDQRPAFNAQKGEIRRGMGMGVASWGRSVTRTDAEVIVHKGGAIEARTGTQDIGQGQRTMVGIVTSEALGVPLGAVNVKIGRSSYPVGPGSGGSVTASNSAFAFNAAAVDVRKQLLSVAGLRLNVKPEELTLEGGEVKRGKEAVMGWGDLCALIPESITGRARNDRESVSKDTSTGHSCGVQFVDLRVDTSTGVIHVDRIVALQACGRVVSRKLAESQIIGGVIQGLSYGLFEERVLDRKTGAMLNPNMEWYRIAGPRDMPLIEPVLWFKDKQTDGPRPLGEPPVIPTAGALACAVFNAIGRPVRSLPLSPQRVLAAMAAS